MAVTPDVPLPPDGSDEKIEILKLAVEAWKKTLDIQQHFNDISLRLRSMAIPVLVGVVGAAAYIAKDGQYVVALALLVMGAIAWGAFFLMDRYWYHLFLRAAGIHAGMIEARLAHTLPEIGLSTAISEASRAVEIPKWPRLGPTIIPKGLYSSTQRLEYFYRLGFIVLAIATLAIVLSLAPSAIRWIVAAGPTHSLPLDSRVTVFPVGTLP